MTLDEYWHGDPRLALCYAQAETIRVRKVQRELWFQGIYLRQAVASLIAPRDCNYFEEPIPDTPEDIRASEERQRQKNLERVKASFMAWATTPNTKGGQQ